MKKSIFTLLLITGLISCTNKSKEPNLFEFIKEYKTTIFVGGSIGEVERTFEVGEIYEGNISSNKIIIRIEEHSKRNEDCPNNWCYQELVDIPPMYMKIIDE